MYISKKNGHAVLTVCLALVICIGTIWCYGRGQAALAAEPFKIPAKSNAANVNVRKKAGLDAEILMSGKDRAVLQKNQAVTITAESTVKGVKWYLVTYKFKNKTIKGHVRSDYITLTLKTPVSAAIKSGKAVKIKTAAGDKKTVLKLQGTEVALKDGQACSIIKETSVSGKKWFQISFQLNKKEQKGYIVADQIRFVSAAAPVKKTGTVAATTLNVRKDAGTDKEPLTSNGTAVKLKQGQEVIITGQKKVDNVTWYKVTFTYNKSSLSGYVSGDFIAITDPSKTPEPTPEVPTPETPSPSPENPSEPPQTNPTASPLPDSTPVPVSDAEFEQQLLAEGFPEDYKDSLRNLHAQYPYWQFRAYHTDLDWNTVIANESTVGTNLIPNTKALSWKSFEPGAYNWSTDKFIPFDGSSWVTSSKAGVEYYMDPRNFLTPEGVFQFEVLSYDELYQNASGVESILKGTALGGQTYTFTDGLGQISSNTYGDIFVEAARYSGVNPYHLATRVKQEVITGKGLSSSANGTVSGYEGLYNFYNIGANNSTVPGGNIANGLKFAKDGKGMNAANKALFMLPWNNHYNAIVGGAKYIGNNYINRGQNTVYLQKFNVTSASRYSHQYMSNVEAGKSEAQKTYTAYKDFADVPIQFSIPVYLNMPSEVRPVPSGVLNPNNWLSALTVEGGVLTPSFKASNPESTVYSVFVDNGMDMVNVAARPVSSTARVFGTGSIPLAVGGNNLVITVTAQDGSVRNYTITVIRAAQ